MLVGDDRFMIRTWYFCRTFLHLRRVTNRAPSMSFLAWRGLNVVDRAGAKVRVGVQSGVQPTAVRIRDEAKLEMVPGASASSSWRRNGTAGCEGRTRPVNKAAASTYATRKS